MATSELETRTFKIHCDCRNDIEVTGWLVAEAIGVYHTLQIVRSVTGEHVVAFCMHYNMSFQLGFDSSAVREFDDLCDWLRSLGAGSLNDLLRMAEGEAESQHLDARKIVQDLRETVAKVLHELED